MRKAEILSSLPLEMLIYFNWYYSPISIIITLGLLIYKGMVLPYIPSTYSVELVALVALSGVEATRLFLGSRGNKTETIGPLSLFLGLTVMSGIGYLFYMIWQTYVLLVDVWVNAIALGFIPLQLIIGGITLVRFFKNRF